MPHICKHGKWNGDARQFNVSAVLA